MTDANWQKMQERFNQAASNKNSNSSSSITNNITNFSQDDSKWEKWQNERNKNHKNDENSSMSDLLDNQVQTNNAPASLADSDWLEMTKKLNEKNEKKHSLSNEEQSAIISNVLNPAAIQKKASSLLQDQVAGKGVASSDNQFANILKNNQASTYSISNDEDLIHAKLQQKRTKDQELADAIDVYEKAKEFKLGDSTAIQNAVQMKNWDNEKNPFYRSHVTKVMVDLGLKYRGETINYNDPIENVYIDIISNKFNCISLEVCLNAILGTPKYVMLENEQLEKFSHFKCLNPDCETDTRHCEIVSIDQLAHGRICNTCWQNKVPARSYNQTLEYCKLIPKELERLRGIVPPMNPLNPQAKEKDTIAYGELLQKDYLSQNKGSRSFYHANARHCDLNYQYTRRPGFLIKASKEDGSEINPLFCDSFVYDCKRITNKFDKIIKDELTIVSLLHQDQVNNMIAGGKLKTCGLVGSNYSESLLQEYSYHRYSIIYIYFDFTI